MNKNYLMIIFGCLTFSLILFSPFISDAGSSPASFAYILQADEFAGTEAVAVEKLAACGRDWLVLDAAFDNNTPWSRANLDVIRAGHPGRKIIAYISIGEAEDYRAYWHNEWTYNFDSNFPCAVPAEVISHLPEQKQKEIQTHG